MEVGIVAPVRKKACLKRDHNTPFPYLCLRTEWPWPEPINVLTNTYQPSRSRTVRAHLRSRVYFKIRIR